MPTDPSPAASAPPPAPHPAPPHPAVIQHHSRRTLAFLVLIVAGLAAVAAYVYLPRLYVTDTDDAYVDAHIVSIVPKVAAYVSVLHVDDNSKVRADELLVELDPRDFQQAVDIAIADLASAQASAANIDAQVTEQRAVIGQSEATIFGDRAALEFAKQELARYGSLATTGAGTTQRLEQAKSDIGQRRADLRKSEAALEAARAHVDVLATQRTQVEATIKRQQALLAQAQLNLSYTKIAAPAAGSVANKNTEVGNYVQAGQLLFSIVPDRVYVTANFKETQLTHMQPGQPAIVTVDAFPGLKLKGHVDSIQRGTGSQFALLPAENATGNFVKVVQRLPVKIVFDDPSDMLNRIAPGMSVEARVVLSPPPWWLPFLK
jgi:membrane fusion protein (multidrug efflux system)